MELTEEQVFAAFGLERENTQAVAEPAGNEAADGDGSAAEDEVGRVSDTPSIAATTDGTDGAAAVESEAPSATERSSAERIRAFPTGADKSPAEQSAEERHANAARRRQQERDAAVRKAADDARAEAKAQYDAQLQRFFEKAQLKNTLNGQPITSMEEFNAWESAFSQKQLEQSLAEGKLTLEALNRAIEQNPAVQQMRQMAQQAEQAETQRRQAAAKARIDADIQRIHERDARVNSMEDLLTGPKADAFYEYVQKGNSVYDAWYLANREELEAAAASGARQQAQINQRGKAHLTAVGNTRGGGAVSVPAEEMAYYRALMPEATDAEIAAHYNRELRKQ